MENEIMIKNKENKDYIDTHIANVKRAFNEYGDQLVKALNIDKKRLAAQIEVHDQSKYSKEEFEGYRKRFYPTSDEQNAIADDKFNIAWNHHVHNNAHHPEFWVCTDDEGNIVIEPMGHTYIAEMLLDWAAMGYTKGDNPYLYWQKEKYNKPLHPDTFNIVDRCVEIFK